MPASIAKIILIKLELKALINKKEVARKCNILELINITILLLLTIKDSL